MSKEKEVSEVVNYNKVHTPEYVNQKEALEIMNLSIVNVDEEKKLVTFSDGTTAPLVKESDILNETKNLNVGQKVAKIFSNEKIVKTKEM